MAAKKKAAVAGAPMTNGVRVIAQKSYDGYAYGAEFEHPKGAKLDKLIADGKLRVDDRMEPPVQPAPTPAPAEEPTP